MLLFSNTTLSQNLRDWKRRKTDFEDKAADADELLQSTGQPVPRKKRAFKEAQPSSQWHVQASPGFSTLTPTPFPVCVIIDRILDKVTSAHAENAETVDVEDLIGLLRSKLGLPAAGHQDAAEAVMKLFSALVLENLLARKHFQVGDLLCRSQCVEIYLPSHRLCLSFLDCFCWRRRRTCWNSSQQ